MILYQNLILKSVLWVAYTVGLKLVELMPNQRNYFTHCQQAFFTQHLYLVLNIQNRHQLTHRMINKVKKIDYF